MPDHVGHDGTGGVRCPITSGMTVGGGHDDVSGMIKKDARLGPGMTVGAGHDDVGGMIKRDARLGPGMTIWYKMKVFSKRLLCLRLLRRLRCSLPGRCRSR